MRMRNLWTQLLREARGLQCRSTVLLTIVVAVATGLTGALYLRVSTQLTLARAQVHALDLVRVLAVPSSEAIRKQDRQALLRIAQELIPGDRLAYVVFADTSGEVLAASQSGVGQLSRWWLEDGKRMRVSSLGRPRFTNDGGRGPCVDIVYPIEAAGSQYLPIGRRPIAGFIRLGLSLSLVDKMLATATRQILGIGVGIVLLMVPLGFEVVRQIVAPINELSQAAEALAAGDLDRRVRVARADEIGRLGESFNKMAAELSRSHGELTALNVDLERRVADRTEQLAASNRRLRVEMNEREEFLRAVSHDLHAPLRNIKGLATMLRRKAGAALSDEARHCLDRIEHNVRCELDLIEELLELSRVRCQRDAPQRIDLDAEVRGVVAQLAFELEKKRIDVTIDGPLPRLYASRRRLRQLFQNLIDNAIKYTPAPPERHGARSTIRVSCLDRDSEYEFRIADHGIGVREEDRNSIFALFNRARVDYVSHVPGRGVGLAYCRGIAQSYGGRMWVEPNSPSGSVFCFTLEKAAVCSTRAASAASEPLPETELVAGGVA
ncbi:MAG: HAMP domain-containing histidine kinase [Phycisphaerae bacterium]|nr:HAMP domain-containing histidine kinase [Phycisphaerae bacterium]